VGISFHLAIAALLDIPTFSCAMVGAYLLFLEPETLPALARRLFGQENVQSGQTRSGRRPPRLNRKRAVKITR